MISENKFHKKIEKQNAQNKKAAWARLCADNITKESKRKLYLRSDFWRELYFVFALTVLAFFVIESVFFASRLVFWGENIIACALVKCAVVTAVGFSGFFVLLQKKS